MPIFEFKCLQCGHIFEMLFRVSKEETHLVCPECGGDTLERVVSVTNYLMGGGNKTKKPTLTSKSCGPGSSCYTLDVPGPSEK